MIIQLSSPLPCQTMRDRAHLCERPTTIALLKTLETFDASNYSLQPICSSCIAQLAAAFPRFAQACIDGEQLRAGYVANLNGERFISAPNTTLGPDDALLILSADAGG